VAVSISFCFWLKSHSRLLSRYPPSNALAELAHCKTSRRPIAWMAGVEACGIWWGSTNSLNMDIRINRNDNSLDLIISTLQETNTDRKSRNPIRRRSLNRTAEVRPANCRGQVLLIVMQWTVWRKQAVFEKKNKNNKLQKFENCSIRKRETVLLPCYCLRTSPWRARNSHWKNKKTLTLYFHCDSFTSS